MSTRLFVGNLAFEATEGDLEDLFSEYGTVSEVHLMLDRSTGRSRGFGFVTMTATEGAQAATDALNGKEWLGRALTVNEARPRESRPSFRSGGGGGGYGRGRHRSRF